jgi:hypothetical protein
MKHLIPYLQDDQKAADDLRPLRWPDGVQCPRGGSDAVEPRARCANGLQRCHCVPCAVRLGPPLALCTDWPRSLFAESTLSPSEGLWVRGLWQLQLHAPAMAAAADLQERTAPRWSHGLDGGSYATSHLAPTRHLEPQVAAEECYQSAGRKGRARAVDRHDRAPRQRGLQRRGRATAEMGRPPLLGLVPRRDTTDQDAPAAHGSRDVLEHGRSATITPLIAAKVQGGAQFFTAEDTIDHGTTADDEQRTVNHGAGA